MALATAAWGHDGVSFSGKDMREVVQGLIGVDGAVGVAGFTQGYKVSAQASPNATVSVASGFAFVFGTGAGLAGVYHAWNDAALNSPSFTATTTNGRKDRLILRITAGVPALEIVQGTASGSPAEPSITGDNYLELALITLPSSTTNVTNAMITDRRVFIGKWAQPWGKVVAPVSWTSDSSTVAVADVANATVTFTAVTGRRYKYTIQAHVYSTVAFDLVRWYLTDGSGTEQGVPSQRDAAATVANNAIAAQMVVTETGISGSVTRKLRHFRAFGTGTIHTFADANREGILMVEDIGPVSNPD